MTLKISTWSYNVYAKNKLIILEFKQATTKAEVGNNSFKNETVMFGMCKKRLKTVFFIVKTFCL